MINAVQNILNEMPMAASVSVKSNNTTFESIRNMMLMLLDMNTAAENQTDAGVIGLSPKQVDKESTELKNSSFLMQELLAMFTAGSQGHPTFSKCCDSKEENPGVAGILEGFGLLNETSDKQTALIENITKTMVSQTANADPGAKIAWTRNIQAQIDALPEEIQAKLSDLIGNNLGFFENTNSSGAELENGFANAIVQTNETGSGTEGILERIKLYASKSEPDPGIDANKPKSKTNGFDPASADVTDNIMGKASAQPTSHFSDVELSAETPVVSKSDIAANIENIVKKISVCVKEDQQELEVELKPEHLGKLSIKLVMDGDGLKAQIKAGDAQIKGILQEELNYLQNLLKDKGVNIDRIDITYANPTLDFGRNSGGRNNNANASKHKNASAAYKLEVLDAVIESVGITGYVYNDSSVEFRA